MEDQSLSSFEPNGKSFCIVAASTAPTAQQAAEFVSGQQPISWRIRNDGSVTVFIGYDTTAALASANSVDPATGPTPRQCIVMGAGGTETFTRPANTFWTAVSASSTSNVYIQPGQGV